MTTLTRDARDGLESTGVTEDVWFLCGPTQSGDGLVHTAIDCAPFTVGRSNGVSMKLGFRTVSGNHAQLWVEGERLMLSDNGSTNGTYVGGKRLEPSTPLELFEEDLVHFAEAPFRIRRQSPQNLVAGTIAENVCDQALALVQFDRLMNQKLVRPHFQPIVEMGSCQTIGFEVLGRGSVFGLESVGSMFQAAEQLDLEIELSEMLRMEGIRVGRELPSTPTLFVNTHPREIEDIDGLVASLANARELFSTGRLVLEIHESAVTDPASLRSLTTAMEALNIDLAYDDFGSGMARLGELIEAKPQFVKFDIKLIRNIDRADAERRKMLETLVQMVRDLSIMALAEGIETAAEARVCREIGFNLAQGYYFGRPSPA